jgi:hypothetical protein
MLKSINMILLITLISALASCSARTIKTSIGQSKSARMQADVNLKTSIKPNFTANVMAPLHVDNMSEFEGWLATTQAMGVDAVSVDVWWGDVEKDDNVFNWSYYDTLFAKIKNHH